MAAPVFWTSTDWVWHGDHAADACPARVSRTDSHPPVGPVETRISKDVDQELRYWQMAIFHHDMQCTDALERTTQPRLSTRPLTMMWITGHADGAARMTQRAAYWSATFPATVRHVLVVPKSHHQRTQLDSKWIRYPSEPSSLLSTLDAAGWSIDMVWIDASGTDPSLFLKHTRGWVEGLAQRIRGTMVIMGWTPTLAREAPEGLGASRFRRHAWWPAPHVNAHDTQSWWVLDGRREEEKKETAKDEAEEKHMVDKKCSACTVIQSRPPKTTVWFSFPSREAEKPLDMGAWRTWQTTWLAAIDEQWSLLPTNHLITMNKGVPHLEQGMQQVVFRAVGDTMRPDDHWFKFHVMPGSRSQRFGDERRPTTLWFQKFKALSTLDRIRVWEDVGMQPVCSEEPTASSLARLWSDHAMGFELPAGGVQCAFLKCDGRVSFLWPDEYYTVEPRHRMDACWTCDDPYCQTPPEPHLWWVHVPDRVGLMGVLNREGTFVALDAFLLPHLELMTWTTPFAERRAHLAAWVAHWAIPHIVCPDPLDLATVVDMVEQANVRFPSTLWMFRGTARPTPNARTWCRWPLPWPTEDERRPLVHMDTQRQRRARKPFAFSEPSQADMDTTHVPFDGEAPPSPTRYGSDSPPYPPAPHSPTYRPTSPALGPRMPTPELLVSPTSPTYVPQPLYRPTSEPSPTSPNYVPQPLYRPTPHVEQAYDPENPSLP